MIFLIVVRCNPITFKLFDFKHVPQARTVARTYPLVIVKLICLLLILYAKKMSTILHDIAALQYFSEKEKKKELP